VNADINTLSQVLGRLLKAAGQTVTTAESCTGGGIAEAITRTAGSSAWFDQAWVVYSNQAKCHALGVSADLLSEHGAVSEPVVRAMAEGAVRIASADWAIAVSGIAGPDGGTEQKPVGTVWLAWLGPIGMKTEHCHFCGDREQVREQAVIHALSRLCDEVRLASQK
jgi:nicotinamide-nucleotide amidase